VYRHADGHPRSVLADLQRLKQVLTATRTERGPAYTAAQFVFLEKLSAMGLSLDCDHRQGIDAEEPRDLLEPAKWEHLDQPLFLLGHGVENPAAGIHGDEEYLYVVELPPRDRPTPAEEWTVRVSEHTGFPRWDGPTEVAFEAATWQYTGPLSTARETLGVVDH
jgi:hypothetical protein